jgi:hypothetical protein
MVMKFVKVEGLPEKPERARYKNNKRLLDEFMDLNVKFAKLEFDKSEYMSARCAYNNMHRSIKVYGYPISIHERNGEVYFERRDI